MLIYHEAQMFMWSNAQSTRHTKLGTGEKPNYQSNSGRQAINNMDIPDEAFTAVLILQQ